MYHHVKKLMYTVRVDAPDPRFGNMLLEQFGGANGELAAAMQYSIQGLNCDDAARKAALQSALEAKGYDFSRQTPPLGNILGIDRCHGALTPVAVVLVQEHLAIEVPLDARQVVYRPRNLGRAQLGVLPYVVQAVFQQPALLRAMCSVDEPAQ